MELDKKFDLIVIGSNLGAYISAALSAKRGLSVLLIDNLEAKYTYDCSSFKFDFVPQYSAGFYPERLFDKIFQELSLSINEQAEIRKVSATYQVITQNSRVNITDNFSVLKNEIKREFNKKFSSNLDYFRLIDFIFDETSQEGPILTYYYLSLILDEKSTKSWILIDESKLKNSIVEAVCDKNCKKIWNKVINNNLPRDFIDNSLNIEDPKKLKQIGAMVGRFQPFHNGHLQLIQTILSEVNFLKIGIGSSQYSNTMYNPFSYDERKEFIIQSLNSENVDPDLYDIYPIPDLHNMKKWVAQVLDVFGNFNIFYSNNDWIRQLFKKSGKKVGIKHVFDFKRFNGTYIRQMICDNESIQNLVPTSVISYLIKIDGIKRVKDLFQIP